MRILQDLNKNDDYLEHVNQEPTEIMGSEVSGVNMVQRNNRFNGTSDSYLESQVRSQKSSLPTQNAYNDQRIVTDNDLALT
eukprot:CAMPEP_0170550302 /NCGR_PEP_ID=MMETSP0211-20121228/8371_1 /TAXON_ID=311385 /ORGANISM="Pseudokeronopsis sp., Strain OXSARD2" /LENGTH=80 /DNA_ID=CAMNT_0010856777 /DNA_START=2366 /DNA_END=2608 /DNA_ORIENTATION=+